MILKAESPEKTYFILAILVCMLVMSRITKSTRFLLFWNSVMTRLDISLLWLKGIRIMSYNNSKSLTLSPDALNNPALLLAELLNQGFTISADSPITVLGGGAYNPAIVIFSQFVKNYPREQWTDILIKRESVLSDYYSLLRDNGIEKKQIQARVDSARQFYIEYGKHDSNVSRMIAGIGAENESAESSRVKNLPKHQTAQFSSSVPTVGEIYTVNESPTLMVKFTKALSGGIRVDMVKGEVLPIGSRVNLAGVTQAYTVSKIVGKKTMTLTPKQTTTPRTTESAVQPSAKNNAKHTGRVAGMGNSSESSDKTPSKAQLLARIAAMLDSIED